MNVDKKFLTKYWKLEFSIYQKELYAIPSEVYFKDARLDQYSKTNQHNLMLIY